jgi:hypothetical protein
MMLENLGTVWEYAVLPVSAYFLMLIVVIFVIVTPITIPTEFVIGSSAGILAFVSIFYSLIFQGEIKRKIELMKEERRKGFRESVGRKAEQIGRVAKSSKDDKAKMNEIGDATDSIDNMLDDFEGSIDEIDARKALLCSSIYLLFAIPISLIARLLPTFSPTIYLVKEGAAPSTAIVSITDLAAITLVLFGWWYALKIVRIWHKITE